ncbi:hypothetical protein FQR65_LT07839 [Abscondita terminalis]|nr:hypothetical protein FQR65_LT07839 [Abscondita terminalis]
MSTTSRFRSLNNVELIQNIKSRRALWDKDLWGTIDVPAREIIWDEVANEMKTSKEVIKTRWKNLRDSYRKLLMRERANPYVDVIKWKYFRDLEFIRNIVLNTKPKVSDISLQKITDAEVRKDPLFLGNELDFGDIKMEHSASAQGNINSDSETSSPYIHPEVDLNKTDSNERLTTTYPNDDDLQFLLSLYPHFRQVPMAQKLPLRIKIEKIVYDQLYGGDNSIQRNEN